MAIPVITLGFTLEPGMSESEIEDLWKKTQQSQKALDNFFDDQIDSDDLRDILDFCQVNPEEICDVIENNLRAVYGIKSFTL